MADSIPGSCSTAWARTRSRGYTERGCHLHAGSAATLRDILTTANGAGLHGNLSSLTPAQIDLRAEHPNQIEAAP